LSLEGKYCPVRHSCRKECVNSRKSSGRCRKEIRKIPRIRLITIARQLKADYPVSGGSWDQDSSGRTTSSSLSGKLEIPAPCNVNTKRQCTSPSLERVFCFSRAVSETRRRQRCVSGGFRVLLSPRPGSRWNRSLLITTLAAHGLRINGATCNHAIDNSQRLDHYHGQ
jgi:hypothetical protein